MTALFVANRSSVLIDGVAVEGLQSLVYRVVTEREDIRAVGSGERVDVSFGLRSVQGELVIKSANYVLDAHLAGQSSFQVVANLKKDPATMHPGERCPSTIATSKASRSAWMPAARRSPPTPSAPPASRRIVPAADRTITIDGTIYATNFQGFDTTMNARTAAGEQVEFRPMALAGAPERARRLCRTERRTG
jgi:hypothetical protein